MEEAIQTTKLLYSLSKGGRVAMGSNPGRSQFRPRSFLYSSSKVIDLQCAAGQGGVNSDHEASYIHRQRLSVCNGQQAREASIQTTMHPLLIVKGDRVAAGSKPGRVQFQKTKPPLVIVKGGRVAMDNNRDESIQTMKPPLTHPQM